MATSTPQDATAAFVLNWSPGRSSAAPVRQAAIIGVGIGVIDLGILLLAGESLRPLFLFSNLGKLCAALLGGLWVGRGARSATTSTPNA